MSERLPRILTAFAIVLGLTLAHGGLYPQERLLALLPIWCGALVAVYRVSVGGHRRPAFVWPIFLPALAATVSLFTAFIPSMGYDEVVQLFFYAAAASALVTAVDERWLLGALVAGAFVVSATMLFESAGYVRELGRLGLGVQVAGTLHNANVAAVVLAVAVVATAGLYGDGALGGGKALALATVLLAALLLAGSRSGLLALMAGLVPAALRLPRRARIGLGFAVLLVIALSAAIYWPRFVARLDPGHLTNSQRLSMIQAVWTGSKAEPLFGYGPWSFAVVGQRFITWPKWELHPHSLPLRVLFESGAVGVLAWLVMIAAILRSLWRERRMPLAAGPALAFLAGSLTDDVIWVPAAAAIFFLLLACCGIECRLRVERDAQALLLVILGALAVALPVARENWHDLPGGPPCFALDRDNRDFTLPSYEGWDEDPWAIRMAGYTWLNRGETGPALELFMLAQEKDPLMLLTPNQLDIAWALRSLKQETEAARVLERLRPQAPQLVAWFEHGAVRDSAGEWTWLDRHYGIEFARPGEVLPESVPPCADPLSWRHHRHLGAQALVRGDTDAARHHFQTAFRLASIQCGTDPVLNRLYASVAPELAPRLRERIAARSGPIYPFPYFSPLIHRQVTRTTTNNAAWWLARFDTGPR